MEMRNYLLLLLALVLFSSFAFADSPVFTGVPTITREYAGDDRNYYDFNTIMYSPIVADADEDLNELSCRVGFAGAGFLPFSEENFSALDFNADLNKCQVTLDYEWGNSGLMQLVFSISDDASNTTSSADMNWWLDNTAPTVVGSATGNSVTLTAHDHATPTGAGAGVKSIYYSLDGANWNHVDANTVTITGVNSAGSHSLDYYALDNFDNNTGDANYDFIVVDSVAPVVGATSLTGFSQVGSKVYGTGTVVGGTATDLDKNTSSCEYTVDGVNWLPATWSTDHCVKTGVTVAGARDYSFNTRIKDNSGNVGTGTALSVSGAMVVDDTGSVLWDLITGVLAGIVVNANALILVLVLVIVGALVVDAMTGSIGIIEVLMKWLR